MTAGLPRRPLGTRLIRTFAGVLVALTFLRVWFGPVTILDTARAQIPDSGLQRKQIVEETRRTNVLLTEINTTLSKINNALTTGTLNVRLQGADKTAGADALPRTPNP